MCTLTADDLADVERAVEAAMSAGFVAGVLATLAVVALVWLWRRSPTKKRG